ncbi:hypothetical protein [Lutibacter sp. B1]|uniref:hypothetical protein n=1 Tax=Lutibacter sp. B1 TaxID=2725996 RepID=UPI00145726B2|nr:hypothetical protein [Lutibacter sp. B1]NLP59398.1 hypothetical protein [Lutibacter sp. B1]
MSIETYKNGMMYENFMCRAFKTTDRMKPGIDISYMRNLIDAENGESWVSHLPSADKQLVKVKTYINKAFEKLIKRRRKEEDKMQLRLLQEKAQNSFSSGELLDIIEQTMEITQDLK